MKWSVAVVVLSMLAPATSLAEAPAKVLGYREVLEAVRNNNAALKAVREGVKVAEGQEQKAWTGWQPQINAVGSVTFNSVKQEFDVSQLVGPIAGALIGADQKLEATTGSGFLDPRQKAALGALGTPNPQTIQPYVMEAAVLTLNQVLFNITALRAPGVAKAARRAALAQVDSVEDDLLFGAATLYATAGGLKALESASDRAIAVADQRLRDAKVQLEAGTATPLAVTRAETDRTTALGQKISLQSKRRGLLANLTALVGADGPIEVSGDRLGDQVKEAKGDDIDRRSSVKARKAGAEAAEAAIGLSNMNWLPIVTLDGQLRYVNPAVGFSTDQFLATATINLVIPLYDRGQRYADTAIAEAQASQAALALEQERRTARAYLEESRASLEAARSELESARATLKLATEAVRQAEDLVKQGLATNLDLSDADSKRFGADQLVVQKELEHDLAALRAYYAAGGRLLE